MKILFIHQNLPAQFRHLIHYFSNEPDWEVIGISELERAKENSGSIPKGSGIYAYTIPPDWRPSGPVDMREMEQAVCRGHLVANVLSELKSKGFYPDLVYAHPAWGEALYVKDIFPKTKLIAYGEFYFDANGRDVGFDHEFASNTQDAVSIRTRNMVQLSSFCAADAIVSPTAWQKSCMPEVVRDKTVQIHDGIDTERVAPNRKATFTISKGVQLGFHDEVITFVNRNLEPYRGFHVFMRALPALLKLRPRAQVVIVGGDDVSYGVRLQGTTYKELLLKELDGQIDLNRVHFVGKIPYSKYLHLLQISTVHVYMTYPFVLSWSMLEAMAVGCVVIGSNTAPVAEVIKDGENGFLVDFFSTEQIVEKINMVCDQREKMEAIRQAARQYVVDHVDLKTVCLPRQVELIKRTISGAI